MVDHAEQRGTAEVVIEEYFDVDPSLETLHPAELHGKPFYNKSPHGAYRFLRVLGTGHYATVHLCTSHTSGDLVAVKALDKHHPEYDRHLALEEVRILAAVDDHPNIATLFEVYEDAHCLWIVQEPCLGGELFEQIIQRKTFSERDAARIVMTLLSVVAHCHSRRVVHRDLKPENFLLRTEARELSPEALRAVDFGLSKLLPMGVTTCHSRVGSSYYVAPEVLKGSYSFPADVWSVGVVAHILLCGFPPFTGPSDAQIFQKILHSEADMSHRRWAQVSATAKDFVRRLLVKEPAERLELAAAMAHPWIADHNAVPDAPLSVEILQNLQAWTQEKALGQMLMTLAARHLSSEAIGNLKTVFKAMDVDHDNLIGLQDLTYGLAHAGIDVEEGGAKAILQALDVSNHGKVNVEEFIAAALDRRAVLTRTTVSKIFAELDRDGDGFLRVEELSHALIDVKIDVGPASLKAMMAEAGALDGHGMVSANSFMELLCASKDLPQAALDEYLANVRHFAAGTSFKQLSSLVMARATEPNELGALRSLFQRFDRSGSGSVDLEALRAGMHDIGRQANEEELRDLMATLDVRHTGKVHFDEWVAAVLEQQSLVTQSKLKAAFLRMDKDGDHYITTDDLRQLLPELGISPSHAAEFMRSAVGAGDPRISFDLFCHLVTRPHSPAAPKVPGRAKLVVGGSGGPADLASMIDSAWMSSPRAGEQP